MIYLLKLQQSQAGCIRLSPGKVMQPRIRQGLFRRITDPVLLASVGQRI